MAGFSIRFGMQDGKTKAMKTKACIVVSSPMTIEAFLQDQLRALNALCEMSVVANAPDGAFLKKLNIRASFKGVPLERKVCPLTDLHALYSLILIFLRERFEVVHSITPKAGLLGMGAAFFARVPVRVHTFTGQVWATKSGVARALLRFLDKLIAGFATHVLVDSHSQRKFLVENGVVSQEKSCVLGDGSISGVNALRFRPNPQARRTFRKKNKIPDEDIVFVYVGRLKRDKGIPELLAAFEKIAKKNSSRWLLLVGPDEENLGRLIQASPAITKIIMVGHTSSPDLYLAASDIFVLPSHREGFGSSVIEAAACGIPAVASRIYGLTDAVVHGRTGLLVTRGDVGELARAMERLGKDRKLRLRMGREAQHRAKVRFDQKKITEALLQFYRKILPLH